MLFFNYTMFTLRNDLYTEYKALVSPEHSQFFVCDFSIIYFSPF